MPELRFNCWWDYDDPEHLVYLTIVEGSKQLWQSTWHDIREFSEDDKLLGEFRQEVIEAAKKYNAPVGDIDSDYYGDWAK